LGFRSRKRAQLKFSMCGVFFCSQFESRRMPWINHRPADELGKNPSELINFSLSISQLWESYLFVIYITIIKIKGAFDDL
jgi:hypothetical protein